MNAITERAIEIQNVVAQIKDHCMCAKFVETPYHYMVIYPEGYFPEGTRVSLGMGKLNAGNKMLEVIERHWKESFI